MRIVAYCTQVAAKAVGKATQTTPLTSPPLLAKTVKSEMFSKADFLYFRLHGSESNTDVWFGEGANGQKPIALRLEQVQEWRIPSAVVVVANCFGSDSPFVQAMYDAGASVVVAIPGENYGDDDTIIGTDLLVAAMLKSLKRGQSVESALRNARRHLWLRQWKRRRTKSGKIVYPNKDTMEFRIIKNKQEEQHADSRNLQ